MLKNESNTYITIDKYYNIFVQNTTEIKTIIT